ncbi:type II toxin-antitoxin system death-on-curing family toxin [Aeromicrobium sp. CF4.19]|uniref:type II toxin-antitoxin system death-on-curing family toxin n=1 Tax=Aeromicrobium sp. CF4.19 TaxID=3373082 RepID=UPI003EE787F3
MTRHLTLEEALRIAESVLGEPPQIRDLGLVESALARPRTSVFGRDAYDSLEEKAAAMLQSLVLNHGLVDGNKRLGFACVSVFLTLNGAPLDLGDDGPAYDLVIAVATGELPDVSDIAAALRGA